MKYDFIEIGANLWQNLYTRRTGVGIIVEPVPEYFNKIPNLPNLIKLRRAIVDDKVAIDNGNLSFFYFSRSSVPEGKEWLTGCGSIFHNQNRQFQEYKREVKVPAMNIRTMFDIYDVKEVDYLKLDVEGLDSRLIYYLLSWNSCPRINTIQFEANVKTPKAELEEAESLLINKGFEIIKRDSMDIIAQNRNMETF